VMLIMKHVSELHDISDICLVTSTTVEPEIDDLFENIIYHFRPALSPFGIFSGNIKNTIPFHDPSVVNSGVGFAQDLGFRTFYFFGCDMGTYNPDLHHAKNSYHFSDDAVLPDNDFCIPLPANFGGNINTSEGLHWVKSQIEKSIYANREGRRYYNCSDGAMIEGTNALFSKRIELPPLGSDATKADFVATMMSHCPIMTREQFEERWQTEIVQGAIDETFNALEAIVDYADFINDDSHLIDINELLVKPKTPLKHGIAVMIRGTFQMMMIAVYYYAARVKQEDKKAVFEDIIREEVLKTCAEMHERASDLVVRLSES